MDVVFHPNAVKRLRRVWERGLSGSAVQAPRLSLLAEVPSPQPADHSAALSVIRFTAHGLQGSETACSDAVCSGLLKLMASLGESESHRGAGEPRCSAASHSKEHHMSRLQAQCFLPEVEHGPSCCKEIQTKYARILYRSKSELVHSAQALDHESKPPATSLVNSVAGD
ncbi:hypothetical protein MHYP_G00079130 [Metynnis hypsauchen]